MIKKKIGILGSTGSIGVSTLSVIKHLNCFDVVLLTSHTGSELFAEQILDFSPSFAGVTGLGVSNIECGEMTRLYCGANCYSEILEHNIEIDILVVAISGFAAVVPCMQFLPHIKILAIATKEAIVCLGNILKDEMKKYDVQLHPIDSEHDSIAQLYKYADKDSIIDTTIMASGGPFWNKDYDLTLITPDIATKHPIWKMGIKNSIDSATMMNKGIELMEAHYLFDLNNDGMSVLIHPQSVIHAIITLKNGTSISFISNPDMKLHIANAICNVHQGIAQKCDLQKIGKLEFAEVDHVRFPAISIARNAIDHGHAYMIAFNVANEVMVWAFYSGQIKFNEIWEKTDQILNSIAVQDIHSIQDVLLYGDYVRNISKEMI